jgi:hypothetical protein
MDVFNEYLRGKQFILFTDHKPLEKLGHLHTKMLNRLQAALLEHDFVVQYKKGITMPADYLSRLPSFSQETKNEIPAFDPFQHDLPQLQNQDPDLQAIFQFIKTGNWFPHLSKRQIRTLATLAPKVFFVKTNWHGSNSMITNILEQRFGYQNSTENPLFANHMIKFLLVTMLLKNRT